MDQKQLKTLYEDAKSKKNEGTYTAQYIEFLKTAYEMADQIENNRALRTNSKSKDIKQKELIALKQSFYDTVEAMNKAFCARPSRLCEIRSMDMLDRSDQNLKELERLQGILDDRVMTIVNQDPKSPRLIQAGRNLREHAKSTVGILKGKADQNYDQMVRSNSDVQIRTAEAVIPQQQDAFLSSLKPDQREYLKQGAEAPSEGGINGRAYRNIHQIISTAGIVNMNDAVDPVSKAKLMNSVVNLQRFYYDNMIREEDRYAFRDQQKATDLISQTGEAFTGVETYIALSGNKEIGKLIHGFMEDMLQDVKDTVNTLRYR